MTKTVQYLSRNAPKIGVFLLSIAFLGALTSCQASTDTATGVKVDENARQISVKPSVLELFSCKPAGTAFVAAHRGTHEGSPYPENTLEGLQALASKNVKFAEVDVARLKDGTLILWHDGVWDRGSTGKGPISSTTWNQAKKLLTKDTRGNITSYRPTRFDDALNWSKNNIYLQIDFKSSVDPEKVIAAIRKAGMINNVILIAYTKKDALEYHRLAPEAAISAGVLDRSYEQYRNGRSLPNSVTLAWIGKTPLTDPRVQRLKADGTPILTGTFFGLDEKLQRSGRFGEYKSVAKTADLIGTDYAFDAQPVLSFSKKQREELSACLEK